jgi:hypothetical protein
MARSVARVLATIALTGALMAATAEVAVRVVRPAPRVQIVDPLARPDAFLAFRWKGDVPLWSEIGATERQRCAGDPAGTRVLLVGDSITFGIGLGLPDTLSVQLAARLAEGGGAWCVINVAQPGYNGQQKREQALDGIAEFKPAVVVWQTWNDAGVFVRAGDRAIDATRLGVDADGWPRSPVPLPTALHHAAFIGSAAWRYATLALATQDDARQRALWRTFVPAALDDVKAAAAAQGGRTLVWLAPNLSAPFDEQVSQRVPGEGYGAVVDWGEAAGVPVLDPADAWRGVDPATLGIDTCCHFNPTGTGRLAALLAGPVREAASP